MLLLFYSFLFVVVFLPNLIRVDLHVGWTSGTHSNNNPTMEVKFRKKYLPEEEDSRIMIVWFTAVKEIKNKNEKKMLTSINIMTFKHTLFQQRHVT